MSFNHSCSIAVMELISGPKETSRLKLKSRRIKIEPKDHVSAGIDLSASEPRWRSLVLLAVSRSARALANGRSGTSLIGTKEEEVPL